MRTETKKRLGGSLALLLAAIFWGTSFTAQKIGMAGVNGFTFNGIRTMIGAAALLPLVIYRAGALKKQLAVLPAEEQDKRKKTQIICGVITGLILFVAGNLQQFAFKYTDSGKVGFITALYMLLVPLFGLFLGRKQPLYVWIALVFGCAGVYLLCVGDGFDNFGRGEALTLACSVFFAMHIMYVDYAVQRADAILLSFTQFIVSGTLGIICMFIFEKPDFQAIRSVIWPILYTGLLSSGAAFTLQVIGQKNTEPAVASLLMCLESVFAVLTGWIVLHERLSGREIVGCVIMFLAVVITNLPIKSAGKRSDPENAADAEVR